MKIGIVGTIRGDILGIPLSYAEYITYVLGGELIILSSTSSIQEDIDLLILPGGSDINPERYGEIPHFNTGSPDLLKEYFDNHHLPLYISKKIPIFGICRGLQTINVFFGGTLIQDMYHETNGKDDPYGPVHGIKSYAFDGRTSFKVNSRHHQAIRAVGEGLIPLLKHSKDDTIEAIQHRDLPIFAVQWHPEDLYAEESTKWITNKLNEIMRK